MATEQRRAEATNGMEETTGYEKRGGFATTAGQDYEVALCCLFFLRALRICRDFYLACNHNLAGDFDDVVLFYRLKGDPGREFSAILLQAKHKDKVSEKRLTGSHPFRLPEYLNSFKSIRNLWGQPLTANGRQITLKDVNIVLYSNTGCNSGDAAYDVTDLPEVKQLQDILNTGGRLLRIPEAQSVGLPEEPDTSDFLGQLLLCVNQMSVTAADRWLQEELCRALRLTSMDFSRQLTSKLKSVVKTWWSDDGRGRYLTPDCEEWKKILQRHVKRLNGETLTVDSKLILGFTAAALEELDVVQRRTKMTWITVRDTYQASVTRERYFSAQKNSLVWNAKYLEDHWDQVEAFWGNYCFSLTIDLTNYAKCEASKLLQRLQEEAQNSEARHLVVIATEQPAHIEEWNVVEPMETWPALDTDTQERLLSVNVELQGNALLKLRDIVDSSFTDAMTDYVIKLLAGIKSFIKIGNAMPPPLDYYVPRCLRRTSSKNINIESLEYTNTLIFPNNFYRPDTSRLQISSPLHLKTNKKVQGLTLVQGRCSDSYIRNMCCKFGVKGIKGEMEKNGFRGEVTEYIPFTWICEDKVIVVEGVPGVGKSSFMTAMCSRIKDQFPEAWILRVDMRKHSKFLKEADFTKRDDVTDLLLNGLPKDLHNLERHLLKHALTFTGNVFLFLDAFDEISPEYTAKCCDLLKGIAHGIRFRQMVVTTRPVTRKDVEKALETQALTLPVFSKTEQTLFLKQFSVAKGKNSLQWEITSLRESVGHVIEIPLLCKMVAEVLYNRHDQSLLQYKDPWRRVLLYEHFVEQSLRHYLAEKLGLTEWTPGVRKILDTNLKQHLWNLQGLAVKKFMTVEIFSSLDVPREVPDAMLGLVVDTGESVDFEHRTFAEFFLGCWLSHHWRQCPQQFLRDVLHQDGYDIVSATFSWSLFKEFPLHMALARGDVMAVKGLLSSGTIDHGGRSPLHVAALTADNMEVSEVLVASDVNLNIRDAILGETAARYAEVTRNWEFLELMHKKGATLEDLNFYRDENATKLVLINAVEKNLPSLLKYILNMNKELLHSLVDVNGNTLLHIAAAYNCIRVLELLIEMKHGVNVRNSEGNTPLHGPSSEGSVEVVRLLVKNRADPSIENDQGETPLKLAVSKGNLEIVKIFIESIFEKDKLRKYGETAMMIAASEGHLEIIKFLIEKGVDTNVKDDGGNTSLTLAARRNHLEVVEFLENSGVKGNIKDEFGADVDIWDENGYSALTLAAMEGRFEVVRMLVESVGENKIKNKYVETACTVAAGAGHMDIVKFLLEIGFALDLRNKSVEKAFVVAAGGGHVELVRLLIESGIETDVKDENENTALTLAAREGNVEVVKVLLESGIKTNTENKYGDTALSLAAWKGHADVVSMLIGSGLQINTKNKSGETALMLSAREGHLEVVKLLIESGVETNTTTVSGNSALVMAAEEGHSKVVQFLLDKGFDVNLKNNTALTRAASNGHLEVVKLLLANGCDVNTKNKTGNNAFTLAAYKGHLDVLKLLIECRAETNIQDVYGNSALTLATNEGHSEVVQFLLDKGFDVNLKTMNEDSALTVAAANGHLEAVKLLLANGCDVNTKNKYGNNAFMLAAYKGHLDVVKLLIEGGAETNMKDVYGYSALTWAAAEGHSKVVQFLLDKGFDVNLKNIYKNSAVMLATYNGHLDVVKLLLENGCDVRCKNKNGDTALKLAVSRGHREIENLLRQKLSQSIIFEV